METFSALLTVCVGNSPVTGEFPSQRPVTRSFDVYFDLRLNKRLSKQSWGWWFETPLPSLWRHCNAEHFTNVNTSQPMVVKTCWVFKKCRSLESFDNNKNKSVAHLRGLITTTTTFFKYTLIPDYRQWVYKVNTRPHMCNALIWPCL